MGKSARYSRISRIEDARGRAGKNLRLHARLEGGNLIVFLCPGSDAVPAKPVIQSQVWQRAPTVLCKETHVFITGIEGIELALVVLAGHADKKICEVHAGFSAVED